MALAASVSNHNAISCLPTVAVMVRFFPSVFQNMYWTVVKFTKNFPRNNY